MKTILLTGLWMLFVLGNIQAQGPPFEDPPLNSKKATNPDSLTLPVMSAFDFYLASPRELIRELADQMLGQMRTGGYFPVLRKGEGEIFRFMEWYSLDFESGMGGFGWVFSDDYRQLLPSVTDWLERAGDSASANILRELGSWYGQEELNNPIEDPVKRSREWAGDSMLLALTHAYNESDQERERLIASYIHAHAPVFCREEHGGQMPANYTGTLRKYWGERGIREQVTLVEGIRHGEHEGWFENGNKEFWVEFDMGRLTGNLKQWYPSGGMEMRGEVSDDGGFYEGFYPDGNRKGFVTTDREGRMHGKAEKFTEAGEIEEESWYWHGKEVSKEEYENQNEE